MAAKLPSIRSGMPLTAAHVNALTDLARVADRPTSSSFGMTAHSQQLSFPPWQQGRAIIVAERFTLGKAGGIDCVYEFRFRYWNGLGGDSGISTSSSSSSTSSSSSSSSSGSSSDNSSGLEVPPGCLNLWETDESGHTLFVDMSDTNVHPLLGDKLTVYYHAQRGMYLPVGMESGPLIAKSIIAVSKSTLGVFNIYEGNSPLTVAYAFRREVAYVRIGAIKANKWAYLHWHGAWWEAYPWEC